MGDSGFTMTFPDRRCSEPRPRSLSRALAVMLALAGATAGAGDAARIGVELNKLEAAGEVCRSYVVVDNGLGGDLASLALDLVVFDGEGVIARRLAVELGPVPAAKTRVKVFDIEGVACAAIGRFLVNGVLACDGGHSTDTGCGARLELSSRAAVPLVD